MKKSVLLIVCVAVFLLGLAGGCAYMRFTPTGILNPASPDRSMETIVEARGFSFFEEMLRADWSFVDCTVPGSRADGALTVFENGEAVMEAALSALKGGKLTFSRSEGFAPETPVYTVCSDGLELCTLSLERAGDGWIASKLVSGPALRSRSVSIAAPAGAIVSVNGVPVPESFRGGAENYPALTELEQALDTPPLLDIWRVSPLYGSAEVSATLDGAELKEEKGGAWDFAFTAERTLRILAPVGAKVTAGGAELSPTGEAAPFKNLAFPQGYAPGNYSEYLYMGLREIPGDIRAVMTGQTLSSVKDGDALLFLPTGSASLYEANHEMVESFMYNALRYGAGQVTASVTNSILPGTALYDCYARSSAAMIWVRDEQIGFDRMEADGFIPISDDCFICEVETECRTQTYYEVRALKLGYTLLYVRPEGGDWLLADMDCHTVESEQTEVLRG